MFPRLMNCPQHQYFNPDHVDGCLGPDDLPVPLPPPPAPVHHEVPVPQPQHVVPGGQVPQAQHIIPASLPPPVFGNPSPLITHIGTPLPPDFINKRSYQLETLDDEEKHAIELEYSDIITSEDNDSDDDYPQEYESYDSDVQWPS